jgi:hypothetical protein
LKYSSQLWVLLGTIFAASCLANPQRPGKQGKGVVQSKQNKKQQAPNNKQKSSSNSQNAQRRVASGKASANAKNAAQPKTANGNRPNQQKNSDTINPAIVKPSNKKVSSKVGAIGGAAGAALAGGAAVMSMPAIWNEEVPDGGDDSSAPPGAVGLAVGEPYFTGDMPPFDIGKEYTDNMKLCVMPYSPFLPFPDNALSPDFMQPFARPMLPQFPMGAMRSSMPSSPMFPPMPMSPMQPPNSPMLPLMPPMPPMVFSGLPNSDDPPKISPDADPEEAKNQKTMWLLSRILQNKPYKLDDPKLNLTDQEKSNFSEQLPGMAGFLNSMMGGPSLSQVLPVAQMSIQGTADAAADTSLASAQLFGLQDQQFKL